MRSQKAVYYSSFFEVKAKGQQSIYPLEIIKNQKNIRLIIFILLSIVSVSVDAQIDEKNNKLNYTKQMTQLNFDCTFGVDLRIYSARESIPVDDDIELSVGAVGIANVTDPIVIEFLAIPNIANGLVKLTFKRHGSNEIGIWEENFSSLLGSIPNFQSSESFVITKDASELPFRVWLKTPYKSDAYRNITVEMKFDGKTDRARATIYPENNNPSVLIKTENNGPSHPWTPNNPYIGPNEFLSNVSNSLDFILNNDLGNFQLTPTIGGNIINDFLPGGVLSFADVQIIEQPWTSTVMAGDYNGQLLISNGRPALKIFAMTNGQGVQQVEGYIPTFIFVLHEMAHIWLDEYDQILSDHLGGLMTPGQKAGEYATYGLSGHNYTDSFEHDLILEKLENPACAQFMFAVRKYYRNAIYANPSQQAQILTIQQNQIDTDSDIFYISINSLTVEPE